MTDYADAVCADTVVMYDNVDFPKLCDKVKLLLHSKGIHATTVQPEFVSRSTIALSRDTKVCMCLSTTTRVLSVDHCMHLYG